MNVDLLFISPKHLVLRGIRKCWKSLDLSDSDFENDIIGPKDAGLIRSIIDFGHTSTLEHSMVTVDVDGVSRAFLQEMSRHRVGVSPSVESTRYTMKKILEGSADVDDCLVSSGNEHIDRLNQQHMLKLASVTQAYNIPNDIAKYGLVEAYKVSEQITFNFRSLRHFMHLRNVPRALWEIRDFSQMLLEQIPEDYDVFFGDLR